MKTKSIGESDAWYPAPQLTAPERAMLKNAIALGFPPAPRRAERSGEGTEVVGVEPCARAPDGTVLSGAELWESETGTRKDTQPAALVRLADGTSHTMRICAALVSDAGTPIAEAAVIADHAMSADAIAAVIADGYGRGVEHRDVDAANARYAALSAFGEEARGLEERIVALARVQLCPLVPPGESYTVRIENVGAELVAQ
ncbi:MAG: hypothetical protein OXU81_07305 [Gammaproteobacteria bacterium]|nr:hypothetical protein [Gammaproteobacteria bacterium]